MLINITCVLTSVIFVIFLSIFYHTGPTSVFPNSCLGLCYFHLVIQGWNKHVQPNIDMNGPNKVLTKQTVNVIKMWVKSWYFDVENNTEYVFSRRLVFHWLKSLSGSVLSDLAVTKISLWIKTNLDPYSTYSLNYHRLHVNGFSARTTSTAESMHNSMKVDGGLANSGVHKSAAKMMDKAQRKGKNIEASNASEISRTKTVETFDREDRGHYLTIYAY